MTCDALGSQENPIKSNSIIGKFCNLEEPIETETAWFCHRRLVTGEGLESPSSYNLIRSEIIEKGGDELA